MNSGAFHREADNQRPTWSSGGENQTKNTLAGEIQLQGLTLLHQQAVLRWAPGAARPSHCRTLHSARFAPEKRCRITDIRGDDLLTNQITMEIGNVTGDLCDVVLTHGTSSNVTTAHQTSQFVWSLLLYEMYILQTFAVKLKTCLATFQLFTLARDPGLTRTTLLFSLKCPKNVSIFPKYSNQHYSAMAISKLASSRN